MGDPSPLVPLAVSPPDRGVLFVVSGPSGVGKSTLIQRALQRIPSIGFSVSATTRAPRPGEVEGVHYRFLDPARFQALVDDDAFLEHATVYDRRYGTLAAPTREALEAGRSLVLDIDAQGSASVRARMPEAVHVVVVPPSLGALEERLRQRGTDDEATIARRMALAAEQLRAAPTYDYVVVNDDVAAADAALQGILLAELSRTDRRSSAIEALLRDLPA
ncbi:MAG: guanylate kinase [Myxococcota bacterium]